MQVAGDIRIVDVCGAQPETRSRVLQVLATESRLKIVLSLQAFVPNSGVQTSSMRQIPSVFVKLIPRRSGDSERRDVF